MLKKILFAFVFTFSISISAQTTLIDPAGDGGFETGATFGANGWTYNFPLSGPPFDFFNQWAVGTGATVGFSGSNCAYVSNSSTAPVPGHNYINQNIRSRFFRDITFPAGEDTITLSFDWICAGEANIDEMTVWLVPTTYNPAFNLPATTTAGTAPTGRIELGSNFHSQGTWTSATITVPPVYAGTTSRLMFEWTENGSGTIGTPPAGVDNISLISEFIPSYCTPDSTTASYWIEDFSTNVAGGTSNISNIGSGFTATGYQDNTGTAAGTVEQLSGEVVDFTADFSGTFPTFGFNIWVDWNSDGDFIDIGEKVYASGAYVTGVTSDFTIPPATPIGDYRMRIRANFFSTDPNSCGSISNGEAEDYTLRVVDVNCIDDPSAIVISAIDFTTATISWTAATPAPGEYEYFVTTNTDVPLYNQVPTGTTISPTTTTNITGLIDGTTYYVWVRSVCSTGFGNTGNWFGSVSFTTLVLPPTTTNISICPGDGGPNYLTAFSSGCTAPINLGTQLSGTLTAGTDPTAIRPTTGTQNTCTYWTTTSNYQGIDFVVDSDGTYTFNMDFVPAFDSMGYIVLNDGNFTPGLCNGTWLQSNDDGGIGNSPQLTVTLTADTSYTLYTTVWSSSNTTASGSYLWNISGPGSLIGPPSGSLDWYTTPTGGTPIFSGIDFDPVGIAGSGLADTNSTGVYSYWAACSSTPNVRAQADFIIGKVWTGATNSDWNDATNWSPNGVPNGTTDCVVIQNVANPPIINTGTDGLGNRLIVENGSTLTQNSNSTLTITDAITVNAGGTYNMLDGSSLIQENNVTNTVNGTFNMARTTSPIIENDYVYWSSPVTSFNVQDISSGTPNGYKFEWLPTVNRVPAPPGPINYGVWQDANTGVMGVGKGYIVKGPAGHGNTLNPITANFNGTPNNGSIALPIERGTHTAGTYFYTPYAGGDQLTITNDDDNWNFIGNPYPSALHAEDFLFHPPNDNIDGVVYLWTHGTDIGTGNSDSFYDDFVYNYNVADYIAVNATGNSIPSTYKGFIAAGQGFFVLMNDASGNTSENVFFENYMRRADYRNDQFFRSAVTSDENTDNNDNVETKHRIWLDFIDPSGGTNTTLVAYVNGATNNKDRMFDAKNTTGNGLKLYSIIEDEAFIIQGRQLPFVDSDIVPLGINITEAGIQTIAINTLEGLFLDTDQKIYIEDFVTGITHNLNNAPYTFTSDIGIINDRFILRYTPNTSLSIEDFDIAGGIKVFEESEKLIVESEYETVQSIEVYDLLGRNLFTDTSVNLTRFTVSSISPNNNTLFLKIKLVNGQQKIAKIIF